MTYWRTCRNCTRNRACERQESMKATLAGMGITSVKHRCPERALPYQPGDPVLAKTYGDMDAYTEDGEISIASFPGFFMGESGSKAMVWIRPGTSAVDEDDYEFNPKNGGKGFCKLPFDRLAANPGGTSIEVCSSCGKRQIDCQEDHWICPFPKRAVA